ncbi:MAG: hypothetical protein EOP10_04280 [Proteobacteria bacterium]|nr:MAG: hypothetical protein EOP10_04280 [Pseudomonadota bacterium]
MKNLMTIVFFGFLGASAVYLHLHQSEPTATALIPNQPVSEAAAPADPATPIRMESIRQITPPNTQTTLLSDTELENNLLMSLNQSKAVTAEARIQSVNCEELRCQVLVEPLSDKDISQNVFFAHLEANPEFGRSLRISPNTDKENKKLLTFIYSQETQVSTTH